jgi:hypothetical protein
LSGLLEHPNELSSPDERNDLLEAKQEVRSQESEVRRKAASMGARSAKTSGVVFNSTFPHKPSVLLRVEVVVELLQFEFYGDVCLLVNTSKTQGRKPKTAA